MYKRQALHLILFVVYMVVLIGQRTEENSAIRRLNGELEQANDRLSVCLLYTSRCV